MRGLAMTEAVAAVDLGATSGRVMLGYVGPNELRLESVARFPNGPVTGADGIHWPIDRLFADVRAGLADAGRREPGLRSIGVDAWAVDYALLREGRMLGAPHHYRDERNFRGVDAVLAALTPAELYAANGLQHLPFNTLFQLSADLADGTLAGADSMLLIPDLIAFWLTGRPAAERTNASTTGLLDLRGGWNDALIARLGLPRGLFPELIDAGTTLGTLAAAMALELGLPESTVVTAVGSHDTASAVLAVPAVDSDFAYISCGTWGLVGVELDAPIVTEAARLANFTNEGGVDGRVRFLHNVMGTWLLSESLRSWQTDDLAGLLAAAAAVTTEVSVFDADDPRFLAPGDIPARIADYCGEHGLPVPQGRAEYVRSIVESLAATFARTVQLASELSGTTVSAVHLVGGGSQNELLCQLTADRCALPVLAGPTEATAIGNVLVQARALGLITGTVESLRARVASSIEVRRYLPGGRR
ncbi:rhamnulokinase [Lacisediminihabitans profunda]|uniref:Rhamnulokinase n=2 Tax=Lacisediminihabitans profunda TaxID=2594790 RepID=A0A5C8UNI2_9MICO|nr:rhamnulokinase [Lacisediminihabitans profunda]